MPDVRTRRDRAGFVDLRLLLTVLAVVVVASAAGFLLGLWLGG